MRQRGRIYLGVAAGGALGSVTRWGVSILLAGLSVESPFWATLAVNFAGSFLIGIYFTITEPDGRYLVAPAGRQFVIAGFCGGFTTFSAFSLENLQLLQAGAWQLAAIYGLASIALWLAGVWLGHAIGLRVNRLQRR